MGFHVRVNDEKVKILLGKLGKKAQDLRPALSLISQDMMDDVEENFESESANGKPWKPLRPITLILREEQNKTGKILQVSGALAASVDARITATSIFIGSDKTYAPMHQKGAKKGSLGKDKDGNPNPWGNVPARPFITISKGTIKRARVTLGNYLTKTA